MAALVEAIATIEKQPEVRHIVSISGGKDSAALAVYLRQAYPKIPVEYVFCDTGCELPETYDYLERLQGLLGKSIVRVNAFDVLRVPEKPGRNPFDLWLSMYGGFLPNPRSRWCTRALKIEPFEESIGNDTAFSYIGIRGDEDRQGYRPKKPPKFSQRPNIIPVYPFKDDAICLEDVKCILEESGLGLPEYYRWRSRSGCYFCFYQQIGEWQGLLENHPDLFERARQYETKKNGRDFTWVDGRTLGDIERLGERYPVPTMDEVEGCAICHL
ncbi:MAG TPA: phosphoadenosine phosphosulfate reductase family protein [Phycisphaerae bacterium]|nr:phosphoadenosine phosphosulfate reductase family protein [Phycisphaerae bacterium]